MGQPQLRAKLDNPKLEQFKQRIAVYYHLNALNRQETHEYISTG
jgi:type II secretory pathway predicted ATPase ExeA